MYASAARAEGFDVGHTARRRVAAEKGVRALEYLQFSDHEEVQRAATEALCE